MERFFVVTGGPGSGKSTLIEALAEEKFARSTEAGRAIIREQVACGGTALPWADTHAFAARMLAFEIASYTRAEALRGPVIFDRGLPDVAGYWTLIGAAVPREVTAAIERCRYNACVFFAPPWAAIFAQDSERKQDFAESERTFAAMDATYRRCGYTPVLLPQASVAERVAFVKREIAARLRPRHPPSA